MADISLADLATLPTPTIIEALDYETILTGRKAKFVELMEAFGLPHDVIDLDFDPGAVLLQEASYEEMILRARGNDIARARYLYFATGSAVDHLGSFYDATRLQGEDDDRYKQRIILAIMGRSTGGTAPRYRYVAMSVSLRVDDAVVYTVGTDPTINIAVFAADNNGVADASLLEAVRLAVNDVNVRMVNDTIAVRSAVIQVIPVTANIKLLPNTSDEILTSLAANLPLHWITESGLGRDLTHDWIKSKLVVSGVYSVEILAPAADVVVEPYTAVRIGAVMLNLAGRDF